MDDALPPPPPSVEDPDCDDEEGGLVNTDERVQEAMARFHTVTSDMAITDRRSREGGNLQLSYFWMWL